MSEQWIEVVKEALKLPGLLVEIYGDLAKPGVKQAGRALETVIGLGNTILWPMAWANERSRIALERNLEKYREEIKHLPDEKVTPVPPEIGVPIAEKLGYVTDEELSDLYINLLAKASCVDTAKSAHPSFVNIINNLSPDEAVLLKEIRRLGNVQPFLTATLITKDGPAKEDREWLILDDLLTGIEMQIDLSFPINIAAYLSNYEGLGLIKLLRGTCNAKKVRYEELETIYRPLFEKLCTGREKNVRFEKGSIDITPFGHMFMTSCLKKLSESK